MVGAACEQDEEDALVGLATAQVRQARGASAFHFVLQDVQVVLKCDSVSEKAAGLLVRVAGIAATDRNALEKQAMVYGKLFSTCRRRNL